MSIICIVPKNLMSPLVLCIPTVTCTAARSLLVSVVHLFVNILNMPLRQHSLSSISTRDGDLHPELPSMSLDLLSLGTSTSTSLIILHDLNVKKQEVNPLEQIFEREA